MSSPLVRTLRVAAVQMACPDFRFDDNIEKARALAEKAAQQGAQIILLPELFRAGYLMDSRLWKAGELRSDSPTLKFLQDVAIKLKVHIGGTFIEVDGEDFYNTFALVGPAGNILGTVRKAETPSFESFFFRDGGYGPHVIDSDLGAIGVAICYETMCTAILRLFVAKHGIVEPDIVLCPFSAPTPTPLPGFDQAAVDQYVGILKTVASTLAGLLNVPVVMANKIGPWQQIVPWGANYGTGLFNGCSTIAAAGGKVLQQEYDAGGAQECVLVHDVELNPLEKPSNLKILERCREDKGKHLFAMPAPWLTWATEAVGRVYYYYSNDRLTAAAEILAPRKHPPPKPLMTRAVRDGLALAAVTCVVVVGARALARQK
eukprot:jgi/Botrbrau1/18300/Bobra.0179s0029.1